MNGIFFLGGNFVSSLICTLKSKKPKKILKNLFKNPKNLKTFYKKPRVFPALLRSVYYLYLTGLLFSILGVVLAESVQQLMANKY